MGIGINYVDREKTVVKVKYKFYFRHILQMDIKCLEHLFLRKTSLVVFNIKVTLKGCPS